MKKVNFKKLTKQFLAGVFALTLMGGVMFSFQNLKAQDLGLGEAAGAIATGDQIPCASAISTNFGVDDDPEQYVVRCDTCEMANAKVTDPSMNGTCKRNTSRKRNRKLTDLKN